MDRPELLEKMSQDVTDFVAKLQPKKYEEGWSEDCWQEEMEKHPFFMSKPVDENQELPPEVEALQQLKYDPELNSPKDLACSYKEDGNVNFKMKKYRWAVDCYSKGLEMNCQDHQLEAELLVNRAAAQFHIGNHKQALKDACAALTLKPSYTKASYRCALCYFELNMFAECIHCCNEWLKKFPEVPSTTCDFYILIKKAEERKKIFERNKRKELALQSKKKKLIENVEVEIKKRGITLYGDSLEPVKGEEVFPDLSNSIVHLDNNALVWPVAFLYLEYHIHDCIQEFHENASFIDHLNVMFNPNDPPTWDSSRSYTVERLQMYFSDGDDVIPFNKNKTLKAVLSNKRYKVHGGIPCFFITVKDSKFDKVFRKRNTVIDDESLL